MRSGGKAIPSCRKLVFRPSEEAAAAAAAAAAAGVTRAMRAAQGWTQPRPLSGAHLLELDELTPPKEVTQIEIPGCAAAAELAQSNHLPLQRAREADHALQERGWDGGEVVGRDQAHVGGIQLLHPHLHREREREREREHTWGAVMGARVHQATSNA